jgi:hypothetical protein
MPTGSAKNIGAGVLVILVIVLAILIFGGSPATNSTTPAADSYSASPSISLTVPTAAPAVDCPPGAIATAPPGPIPTTTTAGHMWAPANYPTTGWCEVAA